MKNLARIVAAFAAGAAAMYYLDPDGGRRRRTMVRDRGVAMGHDAQRVAQAKARRMVGHTRGALARARAALADAPVGDDLLHDRIRARLGHMIDHPGQIHVDVDHGRVVLRGNASSEEIEALTERLSTMRGVAWIDNRLSTNGQERRSP